MEDIFKSGDEREDGDDDANDLPLGYYLSQCLRSSALVANTIIRFDDFVRAHEEKTKEQIRDDRAMAMAIERHNTIVEQSLLNRREMPVDDAADPCANTDLEQAAIPEEDDPSDSIFFYYDFISFHSADSVLNVFSGNGSEYPTP